jgi:hypothetical protein
MHVTRMHWLMIASHIETYINNPRADGHEATIKDKGGR